MDCVDLVFQNGIDWKAFLIAFEQLQQEQKGKQGDENNELSIHSINSQDDGTFVIQIDVPPELDKALIEESFRHKYKQELKRIELLRQNLEGIDNPENSEAAKVLLFSGQGIIEQVVRDSYEKAQQAIEAKYQAKLKAKDELIASYQEEIASLREMIQLLSARPTKIEVNATPNVSRD